MANLVQSIESRVLDVIAACVDAGHDVPTGAGDLEQKVGAVCRIVGIDYDSKVDDLAVTLDRIERKTIPKAKPAKGDA